MTHSIINWILGKNKTLSMKTIAHKDKELTYCPTAYGPDDYIGLQRKIADQNLRMATMAETISIVFDTMRKFYSPDSSESEGAEEARKTLKAFRRRGLFTSTGLLFVPGVGTYIQDNPKMKERRVCMDEHDLEMKVNAGDSSIRVIPVAEVVNTFAVRSQHRGDNLPAHIPYSRYFAGLATEEGAKKIWEIEKLTLNNPNALNIFARAYAPPKGEKTVFFSGISLSAHSVFYRDQRLSALSDREYGGIYGFERLNIEGNLTGWENVFWGKRKDHRFAFGVEESLS